MYVYYRVVQRTIIYKLDDTLFLFLFLFCFFVYKNTSGFFSLYLTWSLTILYF